MTKVALIAWLLLSAPFVQAAKAACSETSPETDSCDVKAASKDSDKSTELSFIQGKSGARGKSVKKAITDEGKKLINELRVDEEMKKRVSAAEAVEANRLLPNRNSYYPSTFLSDNCCICAKKFVAFVFSHIQEATARGCISHHEWSWDMIEAHWHHMWQTTVECRMCTSSGGSLESDTQAQSFLWFCKQKFDHAFCPGQVSCKPDSASWCSSSMCSSLYGRLHCETTCATEVNCVADGQQVQCTDDAACSSGMKCNRWTGSLGFASPSGLCQATCAADSASCSGTCSTGLMNNNVQNVMYQQQEDCPAMCRHVQGSQCYAYDFFFGTGTTSLVEGSAARLTKINVTTALQNANCNCTCSDANVSQCTTNPKAAANCEVQGSSCVDKTAASLNQVDANASQFGMALDKTTREQLEEDKSDAEFLDSTLGTKNCGY